MNRNTYRGIQCRLTVPPVPHESQVLTGKHFSGGTVDVPPPSPSVPYPPKEFSTPTKEFSASCGEKFPPCPACGNFRQWRDAYGNWHCHECEPPKIPSLVRSERGETSPIVPAAVTGGFKIIGIAHPDGTFDFAPESTQVERREAVAVWEFWDRIDARKKQALGPKSRFQPKEKK